MLNNQRVGFACKINSSPGVADPKLNIKTTTITWLQNATKQAADTKLEQLVEHNLKTLNEQIKFVGAKPANKRMFRISSDVLPGYTHPVAKPFYSSPVTVARLETCFALVGELARKLDVRLSFHPGQFCVLASESDQTVANSIEEFEYHANMIRWMGYGKRFQDFKCNIHIGGKRGPQGIIDTLPLLSPEARNSLTIENAEFTWGLEASLVLARHCALVLDIHHHWINSGEYIMPNDARIARVIESWRGVRPVIHLSTSREDEIFDVQTLDTKPDLKYLMGLGFTKQKLRAHSDWFWHPGVNIWALQHLGWADIMLESKEKNLAQDLFID
jgi:UV DNA damage endonuclease